MQHNEDLYEDGMDAWQMGYDDMMFETDRSALPCSCAQCELEYGQGVFAALVERSADMGETLGEAV
jgi:hypothetical protein